MKKHFLLIWISVFLLGTACEEPVDLRFAASDARLVVVSNFTTSKDLRVHVSTSQSVTAAGPTQYVDNATVRLFESGTFLQELHMVRTSTEIYYTTRHFSAKPGVVYTIEVEAPGFATVTGESRIPPEVGIYHFQLLELSQQQDTVAGRTHYSYLVELGFHDPPGESNFYHLSLQQAFQRFTIEQGDTVIDGTIRRPIRFNPRATNNLQIVHHDGSLLFEDTPFDGSAHMLQVPVSISFNPALEYPGRLFAELRTVTEEYYLFHTSLSRQQWAPDQPYADPVLLFNNIRNGHGIFAGYSSSQDSVFVQ